MKAKSFTALFAIAFLISASTGSMVFAKAVESTSNVNTDDPNFSRDTQRVEESINDASVLQGQSLVNGVQCDECEKNADGTLNPFQTATIVPVDGAADTTKTPEKPRVKGGIIKK